MSFCFSNCCVPVRGCFNSCNLKLYYEGEPGLRLIVQSNNNQRIIESTNPEETKFVFDISFVNENGLVKIAVVNDDYQLQKVLIDGKCEAPGEFAIKTKAYSFTDESLIKFEIC